MRACCAPRVTDVTAARVTVSASVTGGATRIRGDERRGRGTRAALAARRRYVDEEDVAVMCVMIGAAMGCTSQATVEAPEVKLVRAADEAAAMVMVEAMASPVEGETGVTARAACDFDDSAVCAALVFVSVTPARGAGGTRGGTGMDRTPRWRAAGPHPKR